MNDKPYVIVDDSNIEYVRKNIFWVDCHMHGYDARDISNSYLESIVNGIRHGKYVPKFLDNNCEAVIHIFAECERRNIFHDRKEDVSDLLCASLIEVLTDKTFKTQ